MNRTIDGTDSLELPELDDEAVDALDAITPDVPMPADFADRVVAGCRGAAVPAHIAPSCDCGEALRPYREVEVNADDDEWVCSVVGGCPKGSNGLYIDWPRSEWVAIFGEEHGNAWADALGVAPAAPTQEELAAIGLSDKQTDAAWEACLARLRADGHDADAIVAKAAANLAYYREHPAPFDPSAEFIEWIITGESK